MCRSSRRARRPAHGPRRRERAGTQREHSRRRSARAERTSRRGASTPPACSTAPDRRCPAAPAARTRRQRCSLPPPSRNRELRRPAGSRRGSRRSQAKRAASHAVAGNQNRHRPGPKTSAPLTMTIEARSDNPAQARRLVCGEDRGACSACHTEVARAASASASALQRSARWGPCGAYASVVWVFGRHRRGAGSLESCGFARPGASSGNTCSVFVMRSRRLGVLMRLPNSRPAPSRADRRLLRAFRSAPGSAREKRVPLQGKKAHTDSNPCSRRNASTSSGWPPSTVPWFRHALCPELASISLHPNPPSGAGRRP
jgi:hypothetical protein